MANPVPQRSIETSRALKRSRKRGEGLLERGASHHPPKVQHCSPESSLPPLPSLTYIPIQPETHSHVLSMDMPPDRGRGGMEHEREIKRAGKEWNGREREWKNGLCVCEHVYACLGSRERESEQADNKRQIEFSGLHYCPRQHLSVAVGCHIARCYDGGTYCVLSNGSYYTLSFRQGHRHTQAPTADSSTHTTICTNTLIGKRERERKGQRRVLTRSDTTKQQTINAIFSILSFLF